MVDSGLAYRGTPVSTSQVSLDVLINSGRLHTHYPHGLLAMKKLNALFTADRKC